MAEIEMLLRILDTIDFRKGMSDVLANHLEREVSLVLNNLRKSRGLPHDDPLRFDKNGIPLSKEQLDELLNDIIDSWPIYKGDWNGRKKNYQARL
jgi:hypothetical protein|tara:strand:+ start:32739 stop:33023 length:285 start_codon:yes stop_codon:yes gene_type:complete